MPFQKIILPIGAVLLVVASYRAWGWGGVALAVGGLVLWLLLHFTRFMHVLRRAAGSPIGYVGSAVMLQARLRRGMTLLHVIAMTRALGEQRSAPEVQPEQFRWTDPSGASVSCDFLQGRLARWEFHRPAVAEAELSTRPGLPPAP
jgi:hypothetical protein